MEAPFEFEQIYNAPVEKVWQALTDENEMRSWYFPQLKEFKPIVDFDFIFSNDGSSYQKQWRVTKVEYGKVLAHNWSHKGYPGSSEVTFELFEDGDKTRLKLIHTGLASFPHDPHFARKRFEDGWRQILGNNLKNHLEK